MEKSARDLEQDLALCEKATPGPWDKIKRKSGHLYLGTAIKPVVDVCNLYGDESEANLSFIAAAREALPYWLGEVKRLREDFIMEHQDPAGHYGLHVLGWRAYRSKPMKEGQNAE